MIIIGIMSALGILIVLYKMGMARVLAYDIYVDIASTAFLMYVFSGTLGGMIAAMAGGLFISITLLFLKMYIQPTPFAWSKK